MNPCPWEPIGGFTSYAEFKRFCAWMNENVAEKNAQKVPVLAYYQNIHSFTEEWYRHIESGTTWRLVWPDPPFAGLFEAVDLSCDRKATSI
jgi:hypothetical protein